MVSKSVSSSLSVWGWSLLLLKLLVQLSAAQNVVCKHECIPLTECRVLAKLLENHTLENIKALQDATCSLAHDIPTVCCPESSPSPGTSLLPEICGQGPGFNRVVGGTIAPINSYPWIAVFGYSGSGTTEFLCAGAVINERYVLTAAHCVHPSLLAIKPLEVVRLGEWDLSTEKDCDVTNQGFEICAQPVQDFTFEDIIMHPDYNTRSPHSDDIALIRLSRTVDISGASIQAVCLPPKDQEPRSIIGDRQAVVAGWGITENGKTSDRLIHVFLPLFDSAKCNASYRGVLNADQVCFGGEIGQDSCKGDSGGPLLLSGEGGPPYQQIGVVSFGPTPCGVENKPGVYTLVSHYRDWIEQNLKP